MTTLNQSNRLARSGTNPESESRVLSESKTRNNGNGIQHAPDSEAQAVFFLGFDWGTHTSCFQGGYTGTSETSLSLFVPTVVGYAKEGIVEDLLPENARVLFGEEALKHRMHLRLVSPMVDGIVKDVTGSREFVQHMRSLIDAPDASEIRAVIGVPANADAAAKENMRQAVTGLFSRIILIPEPFLAALGFRDETKLSSPSYVDPVRNSMFVDIGAGTTDVCLVQGCYPTANDQVSLPFAGDKVDALLAEAIKKTYPDCDLSLLKVREIKEKYSCVGKTADPILVSVMVGGKMRKLDLAEQVAAACQTLLEQILSAVKTLIGRASSDSVGDLLQNIILTGGGSRIRNLGPELQRLLAEEGFEQPCVKLAGENYKEFVAKGALKAARQAREGQWQQLVK